MNNAYCLRTYGISLEEREAIMKEQGYKCPGCGRDLRECRPEIDHFHITNKMIQTYKGDGGWFAVIYDLGRIEKHVAWRKTKVEAIAAVKQAIKRATVRGVCCGGRYAGCNRKLGKVDNPQWLLNMHNYLINPPARSVLK